VLVSKVNAVTGKIHTHPGIIGNSEEDDDIKSENLLNQMHFYCVHMG